MSTTSSKKSASKITTPPPVPVKKPSTFWIIFFLSMTILFSYWNVKNFMKNQFFVAIYKNQTTNAKKYIGWLEEKDRSKALSVVVKAGNLELVKLLTHNSMIFSDTVFLAVESGNLQITEVVLKKYVRTIRRADKQWLFYAIDSDKTKMAQLLLKYKADPNSSISIKAKNNTGIAFYGKTVFVSKKVLTLAAEKGNDIIVAELLRLAPRLNPLFKRKALAVATDKRTRWILKNSISRWKEIEFALVMGNTPKFKELKKKNPYSYKKQHLLRFAIREGSVAGFQLLIADGATVTSGDWRLLTGAVLSNSTELVKQVLAQGVNINYSVRRYELPRQLSARMQSNRGGTSGSASFHIGRVLQEQARVQQNIEMLRLFDSRLEKWSAIQFAVSQGDTILAKKHLNISNINSKDTQGRSLVMLATVYKQNASLKWLAQQKANFNTIDAKGWTPLMKASYQGDIESLKTILAQKPQLNTGKENCYEALKLAKEQYNLYQRLIKRLGRNPSHYRGVQYNKQVNYQVITQTLQKAKHQTQTTCGTRGSW
ncbi:MAG: ankyrin repeat protein [bacterium]|jgi:ankyrin repeat protein